MNNQQIVDKLCQLIERYGINLDGTDVSYELCDDYLIIKHKNIVLTSMTKYDNSEFTQSLYQVRKALNEARSARQQKAIEEFEKL
jgi:hypothetical protein